MSKFILSLFFLVVLSLTYSTNTFAQDQPTDSTKAAKLFVITKTDGTEYIGKIISDDGREVLIETTTLGKIYIPKSTIKSIVEVTDDKKIVHGVYSATGPFTTRYAFTTNALPIEKGQNYALINLYGPEVHFAVSDNFNIGIMSTWIASPLVLAMKYSIKTKNERVNISLGTLMGTSGYLNNFRGFGGLHFANLTVGEREKNITFAAGYAYIDPGFNSYYSIPTEGSYVDGHSYPQYDYGRGVLAQGPIFSIAGIAKAGAKASFVFDSMVGLFSKPSFTDQVTTITPQGGYPDYTPGVYRHTITYSKKTTVALFIMPGMRFQSTDSRAFQVSLAGVSLFRGAGYAGYNNNVSFPFPMCTWFFKF